MSGTNMWQPTALLPTREDVRDEVHPASGMFPDVEDIAPSALLAMHPPIDLAGITKRIIEAEIVSSQKQPLQDRELRTVTVPLRLEWFDGRIRTIQIVVIDRDDLTEEISLDGHTIGFIGHAGHIFVAQAGTRLDRATEAGQCLLWDKAATILVTLSGDRLEPEEPDPRLRAPENTTVHNDRDTGQAPTRQRPRVHEMSRSGGRK